MSLPVPQVFRNPEHERAAQEHGYFKTRLLDETSIEELKQVVAGVFASVKIPFEWADGTFEFTGIHSNLAFVDALYTGLTEYLKPRLDTVFINYTPVMAGVFNKPPHTTDSDLRSHQDPSFVEPPHRTFIAWIPLVGISEDNGSFFVLPGSQHLYPFRPVIQPPVFAECARLLKQVGQPIDTSPGDVVVFDTGLIHWSLANHGAHPRPAIQLVNVPAEAPFFFPFYTEHDEKKRIELYQMPLDHVRRHSWYRPERPSEYPVIKSLDYEFTNLSEEDLIERVGPYNSQLRAVRDAAAVPSAAMTLFRRARSSFQKLRQLRRN